MDRVWVENTMAPRTVCPDQLYLRLFFYQPTGTPEVDFLRAHVKQCEVCRAIVAELEGGDDRDSQSTWGDEQDAPVRPVMSAVDSSKVRGKNVVVVGRGVADHGEHPMAIDDAIAGELLKASEDSTVILPLTKIVGGLDSANRNQTSMQGQAVVPAGPVTSSADTTIILPKSEIAAGPETATYNQTTMADLAVDPPGPLALSRDSSEIVGARRGENAKSPTDTTVLWPVETAGNGDSRGFSDSSQVAPERDSTNRPRRASCSRGTTRGRSSYRTRQRWLTGLTTRLHRSRLRAGSRA